MPDGNHRSSRLGAILTWAALGWLLSGVHVRDRRQNPAVGAHAAQEVSEQEEQGRPGLEPQRLNSGWHREEKEHRRKERQFWNFTQVVYLLTLVTTIAAAGFAAAAYHEAKRQADVAQEALYAAYHPLVDITFSNLVLGTESNGYKPRVDITILSGNDRSFIIDTGDAILSSGRDLTKPESITDFCFRNGTLLDFTGLRP